MTIIRKLLTDSDIGNSVAPMSLMTRVNTAESNISNLQGRMSTAETNIGLKQNIIVTGTTAQYFRGDLSLATFPTMPLDQIQSDWTQTNTSALDFIKNKPPSNSYSHTPIRTIQTVAASGNGWQLSTTRVAEVSYSVTINTTVSLSGNSTGYVALEICPTNSSTASNWIEISRTASGQSGTLVVGLVLNQIGGGALNGVVPVGHFVRLRSVNTTGTPSYVYNSGQEVLRPL